MNKKKTSGLSNIPGIREWREEELEGAELNDKTERHRKKKSER